MVASMESFGGTSEELAELERLQRVTKNEAVRGRRWAVPVLVVAVIVFFASYALDSDVQRRVAPMIWGAFVGLWIVWLRSGNRARARWLGDLEWRDVLPWWVASMVVGLLITQVVGPVSWVLAGVLMALLCATPGLVSWRRTRR